jgi:2-keto-4-pentenoate hydratase/2-oxohepta-3-ene-1,7-dioic acid hydratase in catechol pathway
MKIICIGRNYVDHAKEMNAPLPSSPVFFMKPDTCLLRSNKPFFYPEFTKNLHYELEVVIKICRLGRSISTQFAHRYFNEVALGIDFTARDLQEECKAKGLPWEMAKAFDSSAPISKFVGLSEIENLNSASFRLEKNGEVVQQGSTANMIFSFEELISYVSRFVTLRTGDLIYTGTPAGVGPVKIGDRLTAYLENRLMMDFFVR